MSSDIKHVTFFTKRPRCPECDSIKGQITRIITNIYEEETGEDEDCFLVQDITINCQCGVDYEAKYFSLPLADMNIKIADKSKEESPC